MNIFGENFPYVNFHDLNLDWVLAAIKEVKEKYPALLDELMQIKVNKPNSDPNGKLGDYLISNGDGTTEWKQMDLAIEQDIINAVNAWLVAHPEATTTVQDNSITEAKLTESLRKLIHKSTQISATYLDTIYGKDYMQVSGYQMQGACWNPDLECLCIAFASSATNDSNVILIEVDSDFVPVSGRTVTLPLYHANDITYNPTTKYYYIADNENYNIIHRVNSLNLSYDVYVDKINLNINTWINQISYDTVNDCFYIWAGSRDIYKISSDFQTKTVVGHVDDVSIYPNITSVNPQGSIMYGKYFIMEAWIFGNDSDSVMTCTRLYIFDTEVNELVKFVDIGLANSLSDEAESITQIDDDIYIIGYTNANGNGITRKKLCFDGELIPNLMYVTINQKGSVSDIPLNSAGTFTLLAQNSPTGSELQGEYISFGTKAETTTIFSSDSKTYIRKRINGTYGSWQTIKLEAAETISDIDFTSAVTTGYAAVNNAEFFIRRIGQVCCVYCRFKCSSAISSGNVDLSSVIPATGHSIYGSIATPDNKTGGITINGNRVLYIRCDASGEQYFYGSLTYLTTSLT